MPGLNTANGYAIEFLIILFIADAVACVASNTILVPPKKLGGAAFYSERGALEGGRDDWKAKFKKNIIKKFRPPYLV